MNLVQTQVLVMDRPCINKSEWKVADFSGVNRFPNSKKHLELSLVVVVLAKQYSRLAVLRTETQTVLLVELCPLRVVLVVVEVGTIHCSRLVQHSLPSTNNVVSPHHSFDVGVQLLYVRLHNLMELSDLSVFTL